MSFQSNSDSCFAAGGVAGSLRVRRTQGTDAKKSTLTPVLAALTPRGHGDAELTLRDGTTVAVSRRYREALPEGLRDGNATRPHPARDRLPLAVIPANAGIDLALRSWLA